MDEGVVDVIGGKGEVGIGVVDDAGLDGEGLIGRDDGTGGLMEGDNGISVIVEAEGVFDRGTVMQVNRVFLLPRAGELMIRGGGMEQDFASGDFS